MIFRVGKHFSKWNKNGAWQKALDSVNQIRRKKLGRTATASYGIIDAQSVKTQYASEDRGIDGGKKVKGHKRHIIVDILGNLLHVQVHAANSSDTNQLVNSWNAPKKNTHQSKHFQGMQAIAVVT